MTALAPLLREALARGEAAALISVERAEGSTPREAGATMLVTPDAAHGTIGGGQLEFHAIDMARAMLAVGDRERRLDIPLGPHLGQCCGGRVWLELARADEAALAALAAREAAEEARRPHVLLFGAGHVGLALAEALALLPLKVSLVDDREAPRPTLPAHVDVVRVDDPETLIAQAPAGSAFVVLTHSHALDYRLADAALARADAAYVGMIGSATKRARFERWFLQRGGQLTMLARLACPIGGPSRDKRPAIIAALAAGEIVAHLFAARGATLAAGATLQGLSGGKLGRSSRAA